jgi:hypothetical protein
MNSLKRVQEQRLTMSNRMKYLIISFTEILSIGILIGCGFCFFFGWSINAFIIGIMIWTSTVGFTPLVNRFFALIPKNSGAVIINTWRSYEIPSNENDRTKLQPTNALRETGPGFQGLLLWENVGWVIDLGKQIQLGTEITAYSKDNIELTIDWQVILTPLQGYLTYLVRHSDDTVRKFFEGKCRAKIIELISNEHAQSVPAQGTIPAIPNINERIDQLKALFNGLFGGPNSVDEDERQYGTFTNNPQIINIKRSQKFQKSVEALQINKNNAAAIKELVGKVEDGGAGLNPNQALIGVLSAQDIPTDNLIDVDLRVEGLQNARYISIVGGALPRPGKNKKDKKGEKSNE